MPNGGSDCCGTCWFNRRNRGEKGYPKELDNDEEAFCQIRDVAIEDPFWTYCANHPHRRPERDPIPIGPIMRNVGDGSNDREEWIESPDSEEIRQHLLELLGHFFQHVAESRRYPIGPDIGVVVLKQLGEFRERRAEKHIQWISGNCPEPWSHFADAALRNIRGEG